MNLNDNSIHRIVTKKISADGLEGWEFCCPLCGYEARYIDGGSQPRLEVIYVGDPLAYHSNIAVHHTAGANTEDTYDRTMERHASYVELPVEIVRQVEEILDQFDWDEA